MWFKRNKIPFLSADINPTYIDVRVDIQDIPFSDNEFWFISCDHVLEHVQDYRLAIRELYRVCKPGGYVEISVPLMESIPATCEDKTITTSEECKTKYGQKDHLRLFGADFDKYLLNAGFEVSIYDGNQCDTRILPVIGPAIHDYNKLYICFKPLL
jgi:ubiquinone/menaquinone biosynthesis C-methylase UbiE